MLWKTELTKGRGLLVYMVYGWMVCYVWMYGSTSQIQPILPILATDWMDWIVENRTDVCSYVFGLTFGFPSVDLRLLDL